MLTGKERRQFKKELHDKDPILYIGKNGLTENVLNEVNVLLDSYELIKIKVQKNFSEDKDQILENILEETGAEYIMSLGNVFGIYRKNPEKDKK